MIELTFQSVNDFTTNACNQVCERGKPNSKKKLDKVAKCSRQIGYFGKYESQRENASDSFVFVITLEHLAMIKYDIPDARVMWSDNSKFKDQYMSVDLMEKYQFSPISRFSPLWRHDLSFWDNDNEEFDEARLHTVIREIAGDSLKCVLLQSVWPEPKHGRISRCYREVYQSYDVPFSHTKAHDIQNCIRLTVAQELGIELR